MLRLNRLTWFLATTSLCVSGTLVVLAHPIWALVPFAQSVLLVLVARGFAQALKAQSRTHQVVSTLCKTSPSLSLASFSSARVAKQAHLAADETADAAQRIGEAYENAETASEAVASAAQAAEQTQTAAKSYGKVLRSVEDDLVGMTGNARNVSQQVIELSSSVQAIRSAAAAIQEIATQTRLLSLNAAIEAAHAGETGKGFAVVAAEVRKLSDVSAEQAKRITAQVQDILALSATAVAAAKNNAEATQTTAGKVSSLLTSVGETVKAVNVIAERLSTASIAASAARETTLEVSASAKKLSGSMRQLGDESEQSGSQISGSVETLLSDMAIGGIECLHTRFRDMAVTVAAQASKVMDAAITAGTLQSRNLFSPVYADVADTNPPKKSVGWDAFTDRAFPAIQDPLLAQGAVYAFIVNKDGYVPTHNLKFSQPLTGNYERDLAGNRTKRIFNDKVGLACVEHESALVQAYLRDTGETMHDISVPVYVGGKHWGAVRVGYLVS